MLVVLPVAGALAVPAGKGADANRAAVTAQPAPRASATRARMLCLRRGAAVVRAAAQLPGVPVLIASSVATGVILRSVEPKVHVEARAAGLLCRLGRLDALVRHRFAAFARRVGERGAARSRR